MKAKTDITELVHRIKKGDMLAAELLYERFAGAMYLISFRITNDRMASEDILQEAFVKSFTRIHTLKDQRKYGGWLKQMVVNGSIDKVKKNHRWEALDDQFDLAVEPDPEPLPTLPPAVINKAIAALPQKSRAVFSLYLIEGYTHAEVGQLLGISTSTSKSQYRYALQLLRKALKSKHHG